MKKSIITTIAISLVAFLNMQAQTMNVGVGNVTTRVASASVGDMTYADGKTLTVQGKTFNVSEIDSIWFDDDAVTASAVGVVFSEGSAAVTLSGDVAQYLTVTVNGAHVSILQSSDLTDEITYTLSGSASDGSFYMDGKLKASFVLNGLTLTNPDSAAVNIRDGKRINLIIADGTVNTLTDGSGGSQKACFAVKGHTEIDGGGTLNITGNAAHAFWGKEYVEIKKSAGTINVLGAVGDGFNVNQYYQQNGGTVTVKNVGDDGIQVSFKTDDDDQVEEDDDNTGAILIKGGTLNVSTTAAGAKGMKAEGPITVNEDKGATVITVTTSGGTVVDGTDYTGSACVKSETAITLDAGTLTLTNTGQGGRAMLSDGTIDLNGATLTAHAQGSNYGSSSSGGRRSPGYGAPGAGFGGGGNQGGGGGQQGPGGNTSSSGKNAKGIKAKGAITITDGEIDVYSANHEGLESKSTIVVSGGNVYVKASDDAINSSSDMTISGGVVYAYSTSNDGLDSNGNMYVTGGVAIGFGANGAETGIDIDEQHKLYITGGELFGLGGRVDSSFGSSTQYHGTASSVSCSSGAYFVLSNGSTRIFAVKSPAQYSGMTVLVSSASMTSSGSYALGTATSVSGTETNGFIASPTVSSISSSKSLSVSK